MRTPLLLVLPAPPLPLDQGYRHAAYNDIIQLSRLRDVHLLICNGESVYDFHPDSYEENQRGLSSIPGVKSVSFFTTTVDWRAPFWRRLVYQISILLRRGRLLEDSSTEELTRRIVELSRLHHCRDIHFGITNQLFIDAFARLRTTSQYMMSFTAHDIDADKILTRMRRNFAEGEFVKVLTNWLTHRILLWKEFRACRMSRFVIAMAYQDFVRLSRRECMRPSFRLTCTPFARIILPNGFLPILRWQFWVTSSS